MKYYINPDIDALADSKGEERMRHIRRIAANVGDESALRSILGIDPEEFANFYPDLCKPELSTEDTIDSFISRFSSEKAAETPEIENIMAAPAIDYASMLEQENPEADDTPADETSDMISNFLQSVPPKRPKRGGRSEKSVPANPESTSEKSPETPAEADREESDSLQEALFRLMVKNHNYTKALEIITDLSLNNPKKSIYFAYQIRFLKKLIKNQGNNGQNGQSPV